MVLPRHPKGPVQPPHVGSGQRPPRRRFLQPVQVNLFERFLRERGFPRHSIRVAEHSVLSAAAAVLTHTHTHTHMCMACAYARAHTHTHTHSCFCACILPAHHQESPPVTPHIGGVRNRTSVSQAHRGDAEICEGFITGAVICARSSPSSSRSSSALPLSHCLGD